MVRTSSALVLLTLGSLSFACDGFEPPARLESSRAPLVATDFQLYAGFKFDGLPEGIEQCGLVQQRLVYRGLLFKKGVIPEPPWDPVSGTYVLDSATTQYFLEETVPGIQKMVAETGNPNVVMNIEGPWTIQRKDDLIAVREKVAKHIAVYDFLKAQLGDEVKLGFYGEAPLKDYFAYQPDFPPDFARGEEINVLTRRLGERVDVLFPSYYTHFENDAGWTNMASFSMASARPWGKPIHPFLWMQYHGSAVPEDLRYRLLTYQTFKEQLRTVWRSGASGAVIWGSLAPENDGSRLPWEPGSPWWLATKDFLAEIGFDLSACPIP